jgi:hypothetical protein
MPVKLGYHKTSLLLLDLPGDTLSSILIIVWEAAMAFAFVIIGELTTSTGDRKQKMAFLSKEPKALLSC